MTYSIGIPYNKKLVANPGSSVFGQWKPESTVSEVNKKIAKHRVVFADLKSIVRSKAFSSDLKKALAEGEIEVNEEYLQVVKEGVLEAVEKYGIKPKQDLIFTYDYSDRTRGKTYGKSFLGEGNQKGLDNLGGRIISLSINGDALSSLMLKRTDSSPESILHAEPTVELPVDRQNPYTTVVLHEFGHSLATPERLQKARDCFERATNTKSISFLSDYAATNPHEMLAETYVIHMLNKVDKINFSKNTMELVESIWGKEKVTTLTKTEEAAIIQEMKDDPPWFRKGLGYDSKGQLKRPTKRSKK